MIMDYKGSPPWACGGNVFGNDRSVGVECGGRRFMCISQKQPQVVGESVCREALLCVCVRVCVFVI